MTSITLATVGTLPRLAAPMPIRWQVADLGCPTTAVAGDQLAAAERAHATLVVMRLVVLVLLGTSAMAAGAFIGRL